MAGHFVIGVEGLTQEQDRKLLEFLRENGSWWHWIDDFWLFFTQNDEITVRVIRDKIKEIGHTRSMVLQVTPVTWSGVGPSGDDQNMFNWIRRNWKKDR